MAGWSTLVKIISNLDWPDYAIWLFSLSSRSLFASQDSHQNYLITVMAFVVVWWLPKFPRNRESWVRFSVPSVLFLANRVFSTLLSQFILRKWIGWRKGEHQMCRNKLTLSVVTLWKFVMAVLNQQCLCSKHPSCFECFCSSNSVFQWMNANGVGFLFGKRLKFLSCWGI